MLKINSGSKNNKILSIVYTILHLVGLNKCSKYVIDYFKDSPRSFHNELLHKTARLRCQTDIFIFNEYSYYSSVNKYTYQTTIKYKKINGVYTWLVKVII